MSEKSERWAVLREVITRRSRGLCECCGRQLRPRLWSVQHRKRRGMGGTKDLEIDSPANLSPVCGDGTTLCHGWIEANPLAAQRRGLAIPRSDLDRPEDVPLILPSGRRVLLDDLGFYCPAPGAVYALHVDMPSSDYERPGW